MFKLFITLVVLSNPVEVDVLHSFNNISECEAYAPAVIEKLASKFEVCFRFVLFTD